MTAHSFYSIRGIMLKGAALAGLPVLLSACAVLTPNQVGDMRRDIYQTKMDVADIKSNNAQSLRNIEHILTEVDNKLNEQSSFLKASVEDLQRQINDLKRTATVVSPTPASPQPDRSMSELPDLPAPPSEAEVELMDAINADLAARQFDTAIEKIGRFLQSYPNSAKAPDALFNLGRAEYEKGDFARALQAFSRLPVEYPTSTLVPAALLSKALCEYQLEQFAAARSTLERLQATYPDYETARVENTLRTLP